jgi:CubicO group peptidase (beta-lactamase class C family)
VFEVIKKAIADGPIPGAAAAVAQADVVNKACFGRFSLDSDSALVTDDALFDLASLTKVILTVPLLLQLWDQGYWRLDQTVGQVLSEHGVRLDDRGEQPHLLSATVLQLATHSAGLAALSGLRFWGLEREAALQKSLLEPILHPKGGVLYSDQGYIALGAMIELITKKRLDVLAQELYAGIDNLGFCPSQPDHCLPTEISPARGSIQGIVHDENCLALGGVSGHAGLFGSLDALTTMMERMLHDQWFSAQAWQLLIHQQATASNDRRAFGWVMAHPGWSGGDRAPNHTLGHTGFTGTGIWFNPQSRDYQILLTNRVHPSRHSASGIVELRQDFNNTVITL